MEDLRINPGIPITAFKDKVRKDLKVDAFRTQLYKAKKKAAQLIYGSDVEQYGRLWDYCKELKRKIIGLAGCHLKRENSGQLPTAVGVDPNNAMYPMAWSVVKTKSKGTWTWFLTLLKMDMKITEANKHEWTFINGRQKGLLPAINEEFPRAEHRHCAKHLLANFQKDSNELILKTCFGPVQGKPCVYVPRCHGKSGVQMRGGRSAATGMKGGRSGVPMRGGIQARVGMQGREGM
ncbi:hypothetical protein Vadar_021342 [Vaccinium darrowii]|uniref:Uncharacterized protein n=1 Tax=Vaccinium darrowii TaxID=229202 RepID=A0ACB7ZLY4_9ERIC|nr:hypothetical protein Vadar_021342 [Vaccinium darrowii]